MLAVNYQCTHDAGVRNGKMVASIAALKIELPAQVQQLESIERDAEEHAPLVSSTKRARADCTSRIKQGQE